MTAHAAAASRSATALGCVKAVVAGLMISSAGTVPWILLTSVNARVHPEWPWAALVTVAYVTLFLAWLGGAGWPKATREFRKQSLRLNVPRGSVWRGANGMISVTVMGAILMMAVLWILVSLPHAPLDMTPYPTTAIRISLFVMGPLVSGVIEEAAFRGYMQSWIERYSPQLAIVVTSIVFTLAHLTNGWQALLLLGPGYFIVSVLYGVLVRRTGSILPGIVVHVIGDASYGFFALLGANATLLIAR